MTLEMWIVIGLLAAALVLFSIERIRVDVTAVLIMAALIVSGVLTPRQGFAGFSNTATITVAAMFVISEALRRTGAVSYLAVASKKIFNRGYMQGLILTMVLIAVVSAFINNTPVVAVFIPVLLSVSNDTSISPTRLLLPVSFASMFGGMLTLVGTSTNILINSIAVEHGQNAFGMFEFTLPALLLLGAGLLYMMTFGLRLLPDRPSENSLTRRYDMADYLTDIVLLPEAPSVGSRVDESPLVRDLDIDVIGVIRDGTWQGDAPHAVRLEAGDTLRVRCDVRQIHELKRHVGCTVKGDKTLQDEDFNTEELSLLEVIVAPNAPLVGQSIRSAKFRDMFRATALALRHRGALQRKGFRNTRLSPGDAILIETPKADTRRIEADPNFVVASEVQLPTYRRSRLFSALLVAAAVIVVAALNLLPIEAAAVAGAILLVLIGTITIEEAYRAIDWKVIFLLGGILSLGIAMESSGLASQLSDTLISMVGQFGPLAFLAILYLLTALLTGIMSNAATAVLIAPIAFAGAESLGISARPLLVAVTFAASASFLTPVGYQTNTMIYGVGQYRFADFLKIGTPLTLLFWALSVLLLPVFFPFHG
ncbi:SLC13 family permease [bacterium]|nr:SLC13 family permease [bacterium]